ncbi:hypothetical protein BDV25DRAFT_137706 [Aspergillus avenaceus]|uniref:C2H2-type domain-containing protein n=1 Tax=Aspergillus avenaceus TaxID=36643 RepID=A0A5N6U223_ASPAV|nr:hypothetical protein BDV25DRAFT_137706 [Aspergillus avenaceus]
MVQSISVATLPEEHAEYRDADGAWSCQCCPATFQRYDHFKRHLATHSSVRPHQCEFCGSPYKRGYGLALAMFTKLRKHVIIDIKWHKGCLASSLENNRAMAARESMLVMVVQDRRNAVAESFHASNVTPVGGYAPTNVSIKKTKLGNLELVNQGMNKANLISPAK